ncbi:MAG: hypothetical protein AB1798_06525 [Spirochaetota bacterium]
MPGHVWETVKEKVSASTQNQALAAFLLSSTVGRRAFLSPIDGL